jgi:Peptidase family M48
MTGVAMPMALPWMTIAVAWPVLGLLSAGLHRLLSRSLPFVEPDQRASILLRIALLPLIAAPLVVVLAFAPHIGGHLVDHHCHVDTGCGPHVPMLHAAVGKAVGWTIGITVLTACVAWAIISRLSQSVALGRTLEAMSELPDGEPQAVRADRECEPARLPAFKIVDSPYPFAYCTGLLRSRLLVSRGLIDMISADELDAVLAHEQAHARRHDNLRRLLATISLWPLPRALSRRLLRDLGAATESACDQAAVRAVGHAPAIIRAILAMTNTQRAAAEPAGSAFSRAAGEARSAAVDRIRALDQAARIRLPASLLGVMTLIGYACIIILSTYSAHHLAELFIE